MSFIYKLYHPEIFQGTLKKKNYFEGWYYKIVNDTEEYAYAIIPGVSIGREESDHAFIQVLDGTNSKSYYHSFPLSAFKADKRKLELEIEKNKFSEKEIVLDLPELSGKLKISNLNPIYKSLLSPGIMGWYSFTPFMQCYHGVVSTHHYLNGTLTDGNKEMSFNRGVGYIEKDWGTSFPKCWIWTQSNHFDDKEPISIMASIAHIPWMGNYFIGFLVSVLIEGRKEVYATYNGSKMKCRIEDKKAYLSFKRKSKTLELTCIPGPGAELKSPIKGIMKGKVNESLQAKIHLDYIDNGIKKSFVGRNAGLEIAGEVDVLLSNKWKS